MRFATRTEIHFLIVVIALTAGGAVLLAQPLCIPQTERDVQYFWAYNVWRCAFDALSAVCGVGLLIGDFSESYTRAGRGVLAGLGVSGALLYVSAILALLRRIGASLTVWAAPRTRVVLIAFAVLLLVATGANVIATRFAPDAPTLDTATINGISAFCALGFRANAESPTATATTTIAITAWLAALGWPIWFFVAPPLLKRHVQARHALLVAATYSAALLLIALLITGFETPRGRRGPANDSTLLADQTTATRFGRSLAQVAAASGSGIATEQLADRSVSEGTKAALAATILLGPASYAAGGGHTWLMLLWALSAITSGATPSAGAGRHVVHWFRASLTLLATLVCAALLCAFGLLLIESFTASRFTPAPSFADALLDACSAVGGANLSSGLTASVTDRNLTSGIRMRFDLYQLGMAWIMLFMLIGRIAPLLVLRRLADAVTPDADLKPLAPILR